MLKTNPVTIPLIITGGVAIFLLGLAIYIPLLIAGLVIIVASVLKLFRDGAKEKFADTKEADEEKYPLESVTKEKLGLWIFLASEILIFGSLIIAYVYVRISSSSWPIATQTHNVLLGMTNTIILLTSSLAMILALASIKAGNMRGLKIGLGSAFALGFAFLVIKLGFEWPDTYQQRLHNKQWFTSFHILRVNWSSCYARCSGLGGDWIPNV